jgi:1,4-dihydroxy-2-naphthoate octaprenyltransferase
VLDIPGDLRVGDRTTGVYLGDVLARRIAAFLVGAALLSSILVGNWICCIASAVSFPLFVRAAFLRGERSILLSIRVGAPVLVLIAALIYPLFGLLLLLGLLLTRWYYRRRFGLIYPSLREDRRTAHDNNQEAVQQKIPGT